jgi:hypothetical protein
MAENKTKPTDASVEDYLSAIEPESRREDCEAVAALMARITKCKATMWGPGIVGFDSVHYKYESGREGDMCATGFASRKSDLVVYLAPDTVTREALLAKLGRHKMGKCCLYIRRLEDVDQDVLAQLISESVADVKRRYGG